MKNADAIEGYALQVRPLSEDDGGGFEALFPQLARGVVGYGVTQAEAVQDLMEATSVFLEVMEETNQTLPMPESPKSWDEYSGKFNVRVPKVLHAKLVRLAEGQGVSLNSLIQTILMSGATALEAGCEFGIVVERKTMRRPTYRWETEDNELGTVIDAAPYLAHERTNATWKVAVGE